MANDKNKEKTEKPPVKSGENQANGQKAVPATAKGTSKDDTTRDAKGRFVKGVSGNPEGAGAGRRKGSVSITRRLREELLNIPAKQKLTYLEALVKKMLKKAIVDEDTQMIKLIWNYIDGPPEQFIEQPDAQNGKPEATPESNEKPKQIEPKLLD